jgi:hypothetical protein
MEGKGKTFIQASWFGPREALKIQSESKLVVSKVDFLTDGYAPNGNDASGILLEMKGLPQAYYGTPGHPRPTLNNMNFSDNLWNKLIQDEDFQFRMKSAKCAWGEPDHSDRPDIHLPDVSHKNTDLWLGPNQMLLGTVQVLDTPMGHIIYNLMKSGYVGWSSRGFGDLIRSSVQNAPSGMMEVDSNTYTHISFDAVAQPAVPECLSTIAQELRSSKVDEQVMSYLRKHGVYPDIIKAVEESAKFGVVVSDKKDSVGAHMVDENGTGSSNGKVNLKESDYKAPSEEVIKDVDYAEEKAVNKKTDKRAEAKAPKNPGEAAKKDTSSKRRVKGYLVMSAEEMDLLEEGDAEENGETDDPRVNVNVDVDVDGEDAEDFGGDGFGDEGLADSGPEDTPEARMDFNDSLASELSVAGLEVDENHIQTEDGRTFLIEDGYLIEEGVADGESSLPNGALAVDLYTDNGGDVTATVEQVQGIVSGEGPLGDEEEDVIVDEETDMSDDTGEIDMEAEGDLGGGEETIGGEDEGAAEEVTIGQSRRVVSYKRRDNRIAEFSGTEGHNIAMVSAFVANYEYVNPPGMWKDMVGRTSPANRQANEDLKADLERLAVEYQYGFEPAIGKFWGASEPSFTVKANSATSEDSQKFIDEMVKLGVKYYQRAILIDSGDGEGYWQYLKWNDDELMANAESGITEGQPGFVTPQYQGLGETSVQGQLQKGSELHADEHDGSPVPGSGDGTVLTRHAGNRTGKDAPAGRPVVYTGAPEERIDRSGQMSKDNEKSQIKW